MFKSVIKYIGRNFGNPRGIGGTIAAKIMNIINREQYKTVLENINIQSNKTILDIGFGNGYLIRKILKNNGVTVYGIEISNDMLIKMEKIEYRNRENGRLKLFLKSIDNTQFERESFDIIYTVNTIYFWNDPKTCFAEIKRILKPNGIFINALYTEAYLNKIICARYGFEKYTLEKIERKTEESGLRIQKIIEIKPNQSYCVLAEKPL
jgi:ubiquinone/menaquinone biosynthesis C-methylase UbiE